MVGWQMAYKGRHEERHSTDGGPYAGAVTAHRVLESWRSVPGFDSTGDVDGALLEEWVRTARTQLNERDRAAIGDQLIGAVLARAPKLRPDVGAEVWPPEAVCAILEWPDAGEIAKGLEVATHNRRGVTVRGPTDGGAQERELAAVYESYAEGLKNLWPRAAAILRGIANGYREEGAREDERAAQTQDQWR